MVRLWELRLQRRFDALGRERHVVEPLAGQGVEAVGHRRADIGPGLKEAIEITGKGAPYPVEIIAKEGYDFSRHQAHTS